MRERRRRAESRVQAVEDYARESRCRRARLVAYFGEELTRCSGCDRCGLKPVRTPANPEVSARLSRLRSVLVGKKTVWGGCPLEPEVLLRLARQPPTDAAALADVAGVGPALAERLGGAILSALGIDSVDQAEPDEDPSIASLQQWRAGVAREMGVPAYAVIPNAVLRAIAEARPGNRLDLARIRGVGPRTLAKFGDDLLRIIGVADLVVMR